MRVKEPDFVLEEYKALVDCEIGVNCKVSGDIVVKGSKLRKGVKGFF